MVELCTTNVQPDVPSYFQTETERCPGEALHCTESRFYVLPEMKLRGFTPNSYIHVSVSDYIFPGSLTDT
jgi:hypothetical protein